MDAQLDLSDEAIRKAAIVVAALDTAAADALLDNMGETIGARVRATYMELGEIDAGEQQRVIEQFMGQCWPVAQTSAPDPLAADSTVDELDLSSAVGLAEYLSAAKSRESPASPESRPFGFAAALTGEQLVAALRGEHPQTIAVVLANVAPPTAAAALARLTKQQQADVARRIASLKHVDGEALRELEAGLQTSLNLNLGGSALPQSGLDALQRIWHEAAESDKASLEQSLRDRDERLLRDLSALDPAENLADPPASSAHPQQTHTTGARKQQAMPTVAFEALAELDSASLGQVLRRAESRTLLLALAGASAALIDVVYRQLPRRDAQRLRRQIEQQGPIALRDVAEAQRRLAALAEKLAAAGEIEVPGARRVATAA